jgi:hemerythrin-like domain-containing protein
MSLKAFISTGMSLIQHLNGHHSIEEAHVFPHLARKMPEFKGGRNAAELIRQHREIHKGLEILEEYLQSVRSGDRPLELSVMKEKMEVDGWGDVLWTHLDQEVKTLGAENMRKYCE